MPSSLPAIRPASPADAPAISAVHCSSVSAWKTWDADGAPRPARYADLTPCQRWQNGGPWLDAGACARHLTRLLAAGGVALVAERNGRVLAEAELHLADEPPPYGRNLNLSTMYVHRNHQGQGIGAALMRHALTLAESEGCDTFTVAHAEAPDFYKKYGLRLAERWTRYAVSTHTRSAVARYLAQPLPDAPYESIRGRAMPIGRYQNAHHDWERTRPGAAPDFDEWRGLRLERHALKLGLTRAAVVFEEVPSSVGVANTFLFVQSGFFNHALFDAIRDFAARLGFAGLHCFARSDSRLPGAVATDYTHELFMKRLRNI